MIKQRYQQLLDSIKTDYNFMEPSVWAEDHRIMTSDVSTIAGPFRYKRTPYLKEIIDTMSPYHPAKVIGIMKGSQSGFTDGVAINGLCWMIANAPGNTIFLSANDELSKEIIESRLDQAIKVCGIQHLIRPNTIRKRNQRTGDTSKSKEFAGGRIFAGGVNSTDKLSRQRSIRYGIFDDWSSAPISDKIQGDLFSLLQKRFSTAKNVMKQYYISTPETRPDNIERVFLMGDQRKWHVPCPLCGVYIELKWFEQKKGKEKFGVDFSQTKDGRLVSDSVGYICQECGEKFTEKHKYEMNLEGKWIPTAEPIREGYQSYHISNLMVGSFMFGWKEFAQEWIDIYRDGNERKSKLKVFMNQTLGVPWEERKNEIKKNKLIRNTRAYNPGTVPIKLSLESDLNGPILLITCACDLNGHEDDARLDYDIWAHAANGSIYSIDHGSIGTWYNGIKDSEERIKYTYNWNEKNNVWDEFQKIIIAPLKTDEVNDKGENLGNEVGIGFVGVDTGSFTKYAYQFIDALPTKLCGLKGDISDKMIKVGQDMPRFKPARERNELYILQSDKLKDELAEMINLEWKEKTGNSQPAGFMNFPQPEVGKYSLKGYFEQYENEQKVVEQNEDGDVVGWKWTRKHSSAANHFFDTAYYNLALRDIFAEKYCNYEKIKHGKWKDYVEIICR